MANEWTNEKKKTLFPSLLALQRVSSFVSVHLLDRFYKCYIDGNHALWALKYFSSYSPFVWLVLYLYVCRFLREFLLRLFVSCHFQCFAYCIYSVCMLNAHIKHRIHVAPILTALFLSLTHSFTCYWCRFTFSSLDSATANPCQCNTCQEEPKISHSHVSVEIQKTFKKLCTCPSHRNAYIELHRSYTRTKKKNKR